MLIAIHQPNFLPWCGYFYKMAKADLFVVYDDAQFTRGSYINRCKTSVITLKPAIRDQFKTGHREWPQT